MHVTIPPGFFQTLDMQEWHDIVDRGGLDAEQCARLWRMTDRQDQPPDFLEIHVGPEQTA